MNSHHAIPPGPAAIDYDALANLVEAASAHAAFFLRIQAVGRKVGVRVTAIRTVIDKLAANGAPVSRTAAERILWILSELRLGTVLWRYQSPAVRWNPAVDVIKLGLCLAERARQRRALKEITSVSKGRMLVCMMPSGSFEALLTTGVAKRLEIERLGFPASESGGSPEPPVLGV